MIEDLFSVRWHSVEGLSLAPFVVEGDSASVYNGGDNMLGGEAPDISFLTYGGLSALVCGGARGVIVIVAGIGHGDSSSNPGRD